MALKFWGVCLVFFKDTVMLLSVVFSMTTSKGPAVNGSKNNDKILRFKHDCIVTKVYNFGGFRKTNYLSKHALTGPYKDLNLLHSQA